ncbi:YicC/YloC family endoribonuclease [Paenibacillus flagellatus]|uniref:YicC family protein n=1 Tax=Paenibacillus flagellatus TaxID=2211139 RepID=A0A2V5KX56_9BACL|nr:YicC/YloC family endoribonuclease [Paenibacillus flagellatus]PYI54356.1 YicC family protein [Paenibacillus flagellatus]
MIRSMTGFGQSDRAAGGFAIRAELKSVNHRYGEIAVRMPREWLSSEEGVKREIQAAVKRGKVDAYVAIEREAGTAKTVEIDWPLAEAYRQAAERLKERFGLSDSLTLRDVLAVPGVVAMREDVPDAGPIADALLECVREAVKSLVRMREAEGAHLARDVAGRLDRLETLVREIGAEAPKAVEDYRAKLAEKLADLLGGTAAMQPDDPRLVAEVAIMAERTDIAEELSRLESHIGQCRRLLEAEEPVGRKLDFLIQEMNRETNTIGSKSNRLDIVNRVVDMKAELEKMREQAQNIE